MKYAASHLATNHQATPEFAYEAISQVLAQIEQPISCLFLFLSEEFIPIQEQILQQALQQTHCLNIHGCITSGILTEKNWSMDRPAIGVLAISSAITHRAINYSATKHSPDPKQDFRFILAAAAQVINPQWLEQIGANCPGTIVGEVTQKNPNIWHSGRLNNLEHASQIIRIPGYQMHYSSYSEADIETLQGESKSAMSTLHEYYAAQALTPEFGLFLPSQIQCISHDAQGKFFLETSLQNLRQQFPNLPWIGLFNSTNLGHLIPQPNKSYPGLAHAVSSRTNLLILAHHV